MCKGKNSSLLFEPTAVGLRAMLFHIFWLYFVPVISCSNEGRRDMRGVHVLVSAVNVTRVLIVSLPVIIIYIHQEIPVLEITKDPHNSSAITYHGYTKTIFDWLSESLGFSYSFVPIPENLMARKPGPVVAVDYLLSKRVDIVSSFLIMTPERFALMDLTNPLLYNGFALGQPVPQLQSRLFASIQPFHPLVWLAICLTIFIVAMIFSFYTRVVSGTGQGNVDNFGKNLIYAFTILTGQGENFTSTRHSLRLVVAGWCLSAIVLVNVYNGTLVSFLSVPKYEAVINSFDQLAHSKTLKIAMSKDSFISQYMLNAKSGTFKKFGDSLRENPRHLTSNDREPIALLLSGCCAFLAPGWLISAYTFKSMTATGECKLISSETVGFNQAFAFALAKNYEFTDIINERILYMVECGLLKRWGDAVKVDHGKKCSKLHIDRPKNSPISLLSLSGAFIILGVGYLISVCTFLVEVAYEYCKLK